MSTLTGTYNITIDVDNGTYTSPLTLTGTALINPGGYGANGIYAAADLPTVSIHNAGTVFGSYGGSHGPTVNGGIGVEVLSVAALSNTGTIAGGKGGSAEVGKYGGIGVDLAAGGTVSNHGVITGGIGGYGYLGHGGHGGAGAYISGTGSVLSNYGTISGGVAGFGSATGDVGGIGVDLTLPGGTLKNHGLIQGGYGGGNYDNGGIGVNLSTPRSTIYNYGTIYGGTGGFGYFFGGNGGVGVYLHGGTLVNAGKIAGGAYGDSQFSFGGGNYDAVKFGASVATLVVDPGASFSGYVVGNAAVSDLLKLAGTSAGTITGIGTEFTGFENVAVAGGANWTLTGSNTLASKSQLIVNGNLTVAGSLIVPGSVTGAGHLIISGGSVTVNAGATMSVVGLSMSSGALTLGGNLSYNHHFVESGGTLALAGHTFTSTAPATFTGGDITGSGTLTTNAATSVSDLTVSGATWSNLGKVTENGPLTLSGVKLVNQIGATFDITNNSGITATTTGGVTNFGTFEKTGASGTSTINSPVTNNGTVTDTIGTLEFVKMLSASSGDTGSLTIGSTGTLRFDGAVTSAETVSFLNNAGNTGTMVLKEAGGFTGSISGFTGNASNSDKIEIVGKTGLTDSYTGNTTSGVLTLKQGNTTVAKLNFNGDYTLASFKLTTSGGNTFLTDPPSGAARPSFVYGNGSNGTETAMAPGQDSPGGFGFSFAQPYAVVPAPGSHLSLADFSGYLGDMVTPDGMAQGFDPTGHSGGSTFELPRDVITGPSGHDDHHAVQG